MVVKLLSCGSHFIDAEDVLISIFVLCATGLVVYICMSFIVLKKQVSNVGMPFRKVYFFQKRILKQKPHSFIKKKGFFCMTLMMLIETN